MTSLEDFKALEETAYLLSGPQKCETASRSHRQPRMRSGEGAEPGGVKLVSAEQAWADYLHWQEADKKMLKRINALIKETARTPFAGTASPRG